MSNIYIQEPPTNGKVILHTTLGDLEIEFWPKESPKAVRNFVQLCLEGYYNNTIFHRLIRNFIIQGGDASGTGAGGDSIYGGSFEDEFHQRLKFSHRGLLAMANLGEPNSNLSQFFITLGQTPELNGRNTIFGKVVGETIYNLIKANDMDVDPVHERPLDPPKVLSTEVVLNPFPDIVPRKSAKPEVPKKSVERKLVNKRSLLSFSDEVLGSHNHAKEKKPKSSHDTKISTKTDKHQINSEVVVAKESSDQPKKVESVSQETNLDKEPFLDQKEQSKALKSSLLDSTREEFFEQNKGKVLKGLNKKKLKNENEILDKLSNFRRKLKQSKPSDDPTKKDKPCSLHNIPGCESCFLVGEGENQDFIDNNWMGHTLKFEKDLKGKNLLDPSSKRFEADDYVVIDPRLQKDKKNNQASERWSKSSVTD